MRLRLGVLVGAMCLGGLGCAGVPLRPAATDLPRYYCVMVTDSDGDPGLVCVPYYPKAGAPQPTS